MLIDVVGHDGTHKVRCKHCAFRGKGSVESNRPALPSHDPYLRKPGPRYHFPLHYLVSSGHFLLPLSSFQPGQNAAHSRHLHCSKMPQIITSVNLFWYSHQNLFSLNLAVLWPQRQHMCVAIFLNSLATFLYSLEAARPLHWWEHANLMPSHALLCNTPPLRNLI